MPSMNTRWVQNMNINYEMYVQHSLLVFYTVLEVTE